MLEHVYSVDVHVEHVYGVEARVEHVYGEHVEYDQRVIAFDKVNDLSKQYPMLKVGYVVE